MSQKHLYRYGRGRPKFFISAAAMFILLVTAWLVENSVTRYGLSESMSAIAVLILIALVPLVALCGVLDVVINDELIGRSLGRLSCNRVAWDRVADATQIDIFHPAYGRVVRTYHFRTRPDAVIPAVSFLDTIDDVDSLLLLVNRTLASRDIPMFHKVGERRNPVALLTVGPK